MRSRAKSKKESILDKQTVIDKLTAFFERYAGLG